MAGTFVFGWVLAFPNPNPLTLTLPRTLTLTLFVCNPVSPDFFSSLSCTDAGMVGAKVLKLFEGFGMFSGTVLEVFYINGVRLYTVWRGYGGGLRVRSEWGRRGGQQVCLQVQ